MTDLERMVLVEIRVGSGMQKTAAATDLLWGAGAALTGIAGFGVLNAIKHKRIARRLAEQHTSSWSKLVNKYPEFKDDPDAKSNFDAIFSIAPRIGAIPQYTAPIMRQAKTYGTEGIPLEVAKVLQEIDWHSLQSQQIRDTLPGNITLLQDLSGRGAAAGLARAIATKGE